MQSVVAEYGKQGTKFACVGYWSVSPFILAAPMAMRTVHMLILLMRFSWGARFVCHQLSTQGICKVGAVAHPSFLKESHVEAVQGEFAKPPIH